MADSGGQSRISSADVLNTQAKETSSCFQNVPAERVSCKWQKTSRRDDTSRMTSYGDFCGLSAKVWCFTSLCMHMASCKCNDFCVSMHVCGVWYNNCGGVGGWLMALSLQSKGNKAWEYSGVSDRGTTETVTSPQHLTCPEPELDSMHTHAHTRTRTHTHALLQYKICSQLQD